MATLVDFIAYTLLIYATIPIIAHLISASIGMVVNFILQYRLVFNATREIQTSFMLSLLFSIGGILFGGIIINGLTAFVFFAQHPLYAKIIVIGIVFFYNYATKKIAFGDR